MNEGIVHGYQACVEVPLRFTDKPDITIEFVVDTGFEGALTLPSAAVQALGLPFYQDITSNLADDSSVKTEVYIATILWDGSEVDVPVLAMGRRPLLGTLLLRQRNLNIDFIDGGLVRIESIEAQS